MKQISFEEYIKEHLANFIAFELEKGHNIKSIKEVLMRKGHDENLIDLAIDHLVKSGYVPKVKKNKPYGKLEKEIFEDIVKAIADYIAIQIENGYNLDEIKKTLYDFGHSYEVIEEAIARFKGERKIISKPKRKISFNPFPFLLTFIILLIAVTSILSSEPIYKVAIGFIPLLISIIVVESVYEETKNKYILFIIPIIITLLFFLLVSSLAFSIFAGLATLNLMVLNLILGLIMTFFYLKK